MDYLGFSPTSVIIRKKLRKADTGQGLTGLAYDTSGLIISTIQDGETASTAYTVAASKIETITTLGTYAAPTATKCRFKEVDSTNNPGLYEFQFADARFASTNGTVVHVSVLGATNLLEADFEFDCTLRIQENQPRVEFEVSGGTLTVKNQNGDSLYTKTVGSDATAQPIVSIS